MAFWSAVCHGKPLQLIGLQSLVHSHAAASVVEQSSVLCWSGSFGAVVVQPCQSIPSAAPSAFSALAD